jgi:hypothetical protein
MSTIGSMPKDLSVMVKLPLCGREEVDPAGLDMDSIMQLVKDKYGVLTRQFTDLMSDEKTRQTNLRALLDAKAELTKFGGNDIYGNGPESRDAQAAFRAAAASLPDTPQTQEIKERLLWAADQLKNKDALPDDRRGKEPLSKDDIGRILALFDTAQNSMNTDAQTNMLQMQDVMGKIQTLMSMASNVQSAVHEMQKGLVANLRG